jgi:hypothetical protein
LFEGGSYDQGVAYGISVFPFALSAREYGSWAASLREAGITAPPPARELPTAADLRDAMVSQGCAGPFWPEASSWFYLASEDIVEAEPALVDGVAAWIGAVGGVGVQFEEVGSLLDWSGEWSDRVALYAFDRPDPAAALLVIHEMAQRHGPQILLEDGAEEPVVVDVATSLRETYSKLGEEE